MKIVLSPEMFFMSYSGTVFCSDDDINNHYMKDELKMSGGIICNGRYISAYSIHYCNLSSIIPNSGNVIYINDLTIEFLNIKVFKKYLKTKLKS